MTNHDFLEKLSCAKSPLILAQLAEEVIQDSLDEKTDLQLKEFVHQIQLLLDHGLNPNIVIDETLCISDLQYGYTSYHLDAAKLIFDLWGLPSAKDEEEELSFIDLIRTKIDYNYYNDDYLVKLYLLCCAYTTEETYLTFSPNLYEEMFDPCACYTSATNKHTPLQLTAEIFKDIHKFDFSVEMLPQKKGYAGCWQLHIFDKESKIEVATYE